ncbi:MAG: class I SAM-dependent methyltransferase [Lachnospiraceae bacterium]|nr:class I SAM-dependent methyltransferase [Lachnospiraceae bacterium]
MKAYTDFAKVYPLLMSDVPYDKWEKNLVRILKKHKIKDGLVLDLGCGTGEMTRRLNKDGYDMIGLDISEEMLLMACKEEDKEILYLNQDMRSFELYGTVRAIVSVCDSMNYLTEDGDLLKVLKLANNYLDPGGIFVFDLKTPYFYRKVLGNETFAEELESVYYIWENEYDSKTRLNEYDLTFFFKDGDLYRKSKEVHIQRAYTMREIESAIKKSGMKLISLMDANTQKEVTAKSERIYVVAGECGK